MKVINRDIFEKIIEEADFGDYTFDSNNGAIYDGDDSAVMTVFLYDDEIEVGDVSFCDDIRVSIDNDKFILNCDTIVNIDEIQRGLNKWD